MQGLDGAGAPADQDRLATPGKRVAARVLDTIVAGALLGSLAQYAVLGDLDAFGPDSDASNGQLLVAGLLSLVIWFVWEVVFTALKGGSPMKLALGLRVVRSDGGGAVGWNESLVRWGTLAVWGLLPVIGLLAQLILLLVSLVFVVTRPLRQAVWDLTAKTLVVTAR